MAEDQQGNLAVVASHRDGDLSAQTSFTSSGQASQLTPDSNSDDDFEEEDEAAGLFLGYDGDPEAYELQERRHHGDAVYGGDVDGRFRVGDDVQEEEHDDGLGAVVGGRQRRRASVRRRPRTGSASTIASFELYTPDEEQAVVRKFDRRLVLVVALLYLLSFVDRSNIGNAYIAGMDDDLQSSPRRGDWYEWALTSFYIAYIAFEWMSLLWKVVPAHIYVTIIVMSWGIVASLQSITTSYPMLIALRVLLGIGEAGFTGIPFYLSFFFKRHELAFRTAMFISAAPLATSFASSLAWVILKLGENVPIVPWRLLFLLEGFPSVIVACVAWSVIPDSPQTANYLTAREKKVACLRLRHEKPQRQGTAGEKKYSTLVSPSQGLKIRDVLAVFRDPVAWVTAAMFFLTNMAYSSLPVFLPTILTEMGHDALSAQAMSAPPYLAAFLIVLATAHVSDMMQARAPLIIISALAAAGGYGFLALSRVWKIPAASMFRYIAVYPAAIGFFNVAVLIIAWSINNQRNESRQGGGFALLQVIGQCGPLVGTRLYPDRDGPYYERGMTACAAAMLGVVVLAIGLRFYMAWLNRKLHVAEGKEPDDKRRTTEEEEGLIGSGRSGRWEKSFRYML